MAAALLRPVLLLPYQEELFGDPIVLSVVWGGCMMSSHRNKMSCCCWCGCEWSLLCRSFLGGIVLRGKQSHPPFLVSLSSSVVAFAQIMFSVPVHTTNAIIYIYCICIILITNMEVHSKTRGFKRNS